MRETGPADLRAAGFMRVRHDHYVNARYHGLPLCALPGTRWPPPDGRPGVRRKPSFQGRKSPTISSIVNKYE